VTGASSDQVAVHLPHAKGQRKDDPVDVLGHT
jgi:hypothetical protein